MTNGILLIIILIFSAIVTGILVFAILSSVMRQEKLFKELVKNLTTPKASIPPLPAKYLPYKDAMILLIRLTTVHFQRGYVNSIIPQLANAEGKIKMLSPNDQNYHQFIQATLIQIFEGLPNYLEESIFFYFNVKDKNKKDDPGIITLIHTITGQIVSLLNNQIINVGEEIEKEGPTSGLVLDAVRKLARMSSSTKQFSSPDGTPVTYVASDTAQ